MTATDIGGEADLRRIGVVGCGLMGAGITEVNARAGLDVVVVESSEAAAAAGRDRLERSLQRAEDKGKLSEPAADVLARISIVTDLDALADRQLVVEAIVEDEDAKVSLFKTLDGTFSVRESQDTTSKAVKSASVVGRCPSSRLSRTRRASSIEVSPHPQPTSTTRSPIWGAAICMAAAPNGTTMPSISLLSSPESMIALRAASSSKSCCSSCRRCGFDAATSCASE